MNIKLDENLPERLVSKLQSLGHDVDTVRAEHLAGRDDNEVWQAAQSVARFLITQDLDFSDVRRYTPGTHSGLLLVRVAQPGRDALVARVASETPRCTDSDVSLLAANQTVASPTVTRAASISVARRKSGRPCARPVKAIRNRR